MIGDVALDALADYDAMQVVVAQGSDGEEFRMEPSEAKAYAQAILQAAVSIEARQWQVMEEAIRDLGD